MSLRVVFRAAARLEFEEAAIWYHDQRPGLGEEFLHEIDEVVLRAARPILRDIRSSSATYARR